MTSDLKRVVARVQAAEPRVRITKSNRTLSLKEPQFREFQSYCRARGQTASEVIDELIGCFMAEATSEEVR